MPQENNIIQFKEEPPESLVAFRLRADGVPEFISRVNSAADALALLAFAKEIANREISRIVSKVSSHAALEEIAA